MRAEPWRPASPLTSLQASGGPVPVVLMLGPSGLCNCFDVFHPFYHHIFFSFTFCRMLLRSKNSKSTAPLTLISMPRCVLCCQDFSASFLKAVLSPGSSRLPSVPSGFLLWCLLQRLPRPAWEWKMQLPWAWFCFKSILILEGWVLFLECLKSVQVAEMGKEMGPYLHKLLLYF